MSVLEERGDAAKNGSDPSRVHVAGHVLSEVADGQKFFQEFGSNG